MRTIDKDPLIPDEQKEYASIRPKGCQDTAPVSGASEAPSLPEKVSHDVNSCLSKTDNP